MAEGTYAQFSEVGVRQMGQDGKVNIVFGERGPVAPKPELLQPVAYV